MTFGEAIRFARKKARLSQIDLAERIGVHEVTLRSWERNAYQPRASDIKKISEVLGVPEAVLLNGPVKKEIEVRVVIRESDEEVGKVTMDLSKDAAFLQLVEIGPYKTGLHITFGPEKSLKEVCKKLLDEEQEKIEAARAAVYGN